MIRASVLQRLGARGGIGAQSIGDRQRVDMPILAYELTGAACMRWWRGFSKPLQQALKGTYRAAVGKAITATKSRLDERGNKRATIAPRRRLSPRTGAKQFNLNCRGRRCLSEVFAIDFVHPRIVGKIRQIDGGFCHVGRLPPAANTSSFVFSKT